MDTDMQLPSLGAGPAWAASGMFSQGGEIKSQTVFACDRHVFERATVGIFQTTPAGRFLHANPALARLLGYASPEALIAAVGDIGRELHVDAGRRKEFAQVLRVNGAVMNFECALRHRDGQTIWVSENAWAVRNDEGRVLYFEGFVEDISQAKQQRESRKQAEAAQARREAQRQVMCGIGDQLRGPLHAVISMLDLLASTELTSLQRNYARMASLSAHSLLSITNDVLAIDEPQPANFPCRSVP